MDRGRTPSNPELIRLRQQSALRKYRRSRRYAAFLWLIAGVLLALLVVEALVVSCFSPRMWIYRVEVGGVETLTPSQVIRLTGLREHSNFYRTSVAALAARIERHPSVARATVRRGNVGVLQIDVRERQPACRLTTGTPVLYLDESGVVFTRARPPAVPVPLLVGIPAPVPAMVGKRLRARRISDALACLAALRDPSLGDAPLEPTRVSVAPEDGATTLILRQGTRVLLGRPEHLPAKLWVVHQAVINAATRGQELAEIAQIDVRGAQPEELQAFIKLRGGQEAATP